MSPTHYDGRRPATAFLSFALLWLALTADLGAKPNVLLILADDVGCEVLGCYGGQSYRTPHLDQLAASGMRFTHNYSMPVCHPTRIALLTGRYPFRLGNPAWGTYPRSAEQQTFAHAMRAGGYATAIAGKWQLTMLGEEPDHPHRLGFDEYSLFGWHEGPRYYEPMVYENGKVRPDTGNKYGPDVYTEFLIDFMRRHRKEPFCAFYSMALCHDVTDDLAEPVPHGPADRYDTYLEMAEAMDERVGRLVAALDEMRLRENTLVLFTTDNGTPKRYIHSAAGEDLIRKPVVSKWRGVEVPGGKGELNDSGTNVPLIACWPGTITPGQVVDDLVDLSDFYATLVDVADVSPPDRPRRDGISFAPRLRGERPSRRNWAFAEHGGRSWVRTTRWKLYDGGQLFDLQADPSEQRAVGETGPSAAARRELEQAFRELRIGDDR